MKHRKMSLVEDMYGEQYKEITPGSSRRSVLDLDRVATDHTEQRHSVWTVQSPLCAMQNIQNLQCLLEDKTSKESLR